MVSHLKLPKWPPLSIVNPVDVAVWEANFTLLETLCILTVSIISTTSFIYKILWCQADIFHDSDQNIGILHKVFEAIWVFDSKHPPWQFTKKTLLRQLIKYCILSNFQGYSLLHDKLITWLYDILITGNSIFIYCFYGNQFITINPSTLMYLLVLPDVCRDTGMLPHHWSYSINHQVRLTRLVTWSDLLSISHIWLGLFSQSHDLTYWIIHMVWLTQ